MSSIGRTLGRGVLRDIALTCLAVLFIGLSYGAIAGASLGALIGSAVHDTGAFGLDAMFPAVILALIVPDLRERMTLRAALAGAAVALVATSFLPAGLPVLLALVAVLLLLRQPSSG